MTWVKVREVRSSQEIMSLGKRRKESFKPQQQCLSAIYRLLPRESYIFGIPNARVCVTLVWTYLALVSAYGESCVCFASAVPRRDSVGRADRAE